MPTELSVNDCIAWHKIRLRFDLDEVEQAAIAGTITCLERIKEVIRCSQAAPTEDSHYLQTGQWNWGEK